MRNLIQKTSALLVAAVSVVTLSGCESTPKNDNVRVFYTDATIISLETATRCSGNGNSNGPSLLAIIGGAALGAHFGGSDRAKAGFALLGGAAGGAISSGASSREPYGRQRCNDNFYIAKVSFIDPLTMRKEISTVKLSSRPYSKHLENVKIVAPKLPLSNTPVR